MFRTRLNVTFGLALISLLLTPVCSPAADSAAVIPLFSSQKTVATGTAIGGKSTHGIGVYGFTEDGYGVIGQDAGTTQGKGYGGYFISNSGIPVYARSTATGASTGTVWNPGIYGRSWRGPGVLGVGEESTYSGAYGGYFTGYRGVVGVGQNLNSNNYGGYFTGYRGVAGVGQNSYAGYFTNSGGSTSPGLYVLGYSDFYGYAWFNNGKFGFVVDMAVNDGPDYLETGDLVVITGYDEPIIGEIPLIRVSKCTIAASPAIVGVVDRQHTVPPPEPNADTENDADDTGTVPRPAATLASLDDGTGIAPGEYLSIVTLGSYKAIKADATGGPIEPGSLLVASPEPGYVMAADSPSPGTIVGKALGGLDSGTGLIPVMVTLH